jgi:hypothetical protein
MARTSLDWFTDSCGVGARAVIRDPITNLMIAAAWVNRQHSTGRWGYAVERACDGEMRYGYRSTEAGAREGTEIVVAAWLVGPILMSGQPLAR